MDEGFEFDVSRVVVHHPLCILCDDVLCGILVKFSLAVVFG